MINIGIKRDGSTSTLFTKIDEIITLMINEINSDEIIKRYLTFLTTQPLENKSLDKNGTVLYQYDIPSKLDIPTVKYCISKPTATTKEYRTSEQILYSEPYQDAKITGNYPVLFVHNYSYDCNNIVGSNIYMVDILIPSEYLNVNSVGSPVIESRLHKIMGRIAYLFDKVSLDEVSREYLGDIEFKIVGKSMEEKINKTNDITITTISIETRIINARSDYSNGILR